MEQIHGAAEAEQFIAKGKYEEDEDSDGDIVYRKVTKERTLAKTRAQEVVIKRSLV